MIKLAMAVISALVLSSVSAQALVVQRTLDFWLARDFAYGPTQDFTVSLNRSLGRVVSVTYQFAAVEEWDVPIIITGPLHRNPTMRMSFEGDIIDYTDYPYEDLASIKTPLADVTSRDPEGVTMRGWLSGSFRDDPNLYTNLLSDGSYGRTLTVFPRIGWNGNRVCSGPCNWYVDFSIDQGISLKGTLIESVDYAPFFVPEPSSIGLLTLGVIATGFAAARRAL